MVECCPIKEVINELVAFVKSVPPPEAKSSEE